MGYKPNKKHGKYLLIAECINLLIVLFDTILKFCLRQTGVYRFFHQLIRPDANFYWTTSGFVCIALIPVTLILCAVNLRLQRHKKVNFYSKANLGICLFTLAYQLLILMIVAYNNGVFN